MVSDNVRTQIFKNLKTLKKTFCSEEKDWTYSEASAYVDLLVNYLEMRHIKRIAVEATQSFFTYVLLIASYLAKVVFCCYDPELPQNRKLAIIHDYRPDFIVSVSAEEETGTNLNCYNFTACNCMEEKKESQINNDISYVIYTSGSSGIPKGVLIRYESLENVVVWGISRFGLTMKDVWAQYAPLWFDMSMFDLFGATASGAQLVPFSTKNMKLLPGPIIKLKRISFWNSVPQAFSYIKARSQLNIDNLASLRAIKLGGDRVLEPLVESIFQVLPEVELFITYGPTEGTIFATCLHLCKTNYKTYYMHGSVPIGNAIQGIELCLDKIKDGIGEILLKGNNVASGYIGNQLNGSFSYAGGQLTRVFHTGDYGYIFDNCYYFIGRYDSQVKLSGNRLDLAEIETLLAAKSILSCCLLMDNQIILAYEKTYYCTNYDLTDYLKNNLPQFAIPKIIIALENLPVNANGKVDRSRILEVVKNGA